MNESSQHIQLKEMHKKLIKNKNSIFLPIMRNLEIWASYIPFFEAK